LFIGRAIQASWHDVIHMKCCRLANLRQMTVLAAAQVSAEDVLPQFSRNGGQAHAALDD
jgi:hypothetical protein